MANEDGKYQDEVDYDVIIVGCGVTGLSTAFNISKKDSGITVLVLESSGLLRDLRKTWKPEASEGFVYIYRVAHFMCREWEELKGEGLKVDSIIILTETQIDKIGGRLGISGAASRGFFIDDKQTHIKRFIRDLGLSTVYRRRIENEKRVHYTRNGPIVQEEEAFDEINGFIEGLDLTAEGLRGLRTYGDYPEANKLARMSLDSLISKYLSSSKARELMNAIAYSICGVESISVSALWFIVMAIGAGGLKRRINFSLGTNRRQFVEDGACKILEKLLNVIEADQRIEIQTESAVDSIEFNDVYAYVSVSDGDQYKCQYVVVAVPPPHNSKIVIQPERKNVVESQISHEPGKGTFFVATYDEAWWLKNNYSGEIIGSRNNPSGLRLVYEASTTQKSPVFLSGFFEGMKSGKKERSNHPLEYLRNCWSENKVPTSFSTRCKSYSEWEWTDVKEGGGYPMSAMRPCDLKSHVNPMMTPHERVYWACSEYARFWPGTLDGAVESGEHVARTILFNLRPQSLSSQELRSITPDTPMKKNDLPLDLVALHFVLSVVSAAVLVIYCKPVK